MKTSSDKMIAIKEDGIGWLIFNNPERRNAISDEMRIATVSILEDFAQDSEVKVIVMKGTGEKSFVSGSDISQLEKRSKDSDSIAAATLIGDRLQSKFFGLKKPLIASIQGYCLGAGLSLALNADIRIAADKALFGIPAARLGLAYGFRQTKQLVELVGPACAKAILFTGRQYSAAEALGFGLVTEVVAHNQLDQATRSLASLIAGNAPLTLLAAKIMVNEAVKDLSQRDELACEKITEICRSSYDRIEGRAAFLEKRRPSFIGS